ncbi:MAG: family 16 glycosylhydrolase [Sphingomonadaceae bacterium]
MMASARTLTLLASAALASACQSAPERPKKVITTVDRPASGTARMPGQESGWELVWADEFDGDEIDIGKWQFDVDCWGGGNNERQCYTDSPRNAAVADGVLRIVARKESHTGPAYPPHVKASQSDPDALATKPFTSARLVTRGKAAWQYGRIEVRARLPQGQGTWPAIWMLPEDNAYGTWAASGEIDILEAVNLGVPCAKCPGGVEDTILGTLHFGGLWPDNALNSSEMHAPEVLEGFHTYGIVWAPGVIEWTHNGQVFARKEAGSWWSVNSADPLAPFDKPFHLILNLAIGGGLAEERGLGGVDETGFPKSLDVDWVRVWQCRPDPANGAGCTGDR